MPSLTIIKIVALIALCLGFEVHGRHAEEKKWIQKEFEAKVQAEEIKNEQERMVRRNISMINDNHYKEQQNAQVKIDSLVSDVRTGKQRLSVAVSSCSPARDSTTPTGTVTEARAEILPKTAIDLIELAAGADEEVRRTNLCIDQYNAVRDTITKLP